MKNGFQSFDSDMHVYDAANLYEKYMNPKWGDRIPIGQRNGKHGRVEFKLGGGKKTARDHRRYQPRPASKWPIATILPWRGTTIRCPS